MKIYPFKRELGKDAQGTLCIHVMHAFRYVKTSCYDHLGGPIRPFARPCQKSGSLIYMPSKSSKVSSNLPVDPMDYLRRPTWPLGPPNISIDSFWPSRSAVECTCSAVLQIIRGSIKCLKFTAGNHLDIPLDPHWTPLTSHLTLWDLYTKISPWPRT